jgi:hypothetical protein
MAVSWSRVEMRVRSIRPGARPLAMILAVRLGASAKITARNYDTQTSRWTATSLPAGRQGWPADLAAPSSSDLCLPIAFRASCIICCRLSGLADVDRRRLIAARTLAASTPPDGPPPARLEIMASRHHQIAQLVLETHRPSARTNRRHRGEQLATARKRPEPVKQPRRRSSSGIRAGRRTGQLQQVADVAEGHAMRRIPASR